MKKLDFKKKVWIARQMDMNKRERTAATIAKIQGISRQHAYRIWKDCKDRGIEALEERHIGRPKEYLTNTEIQAILQYYIKQKQGEVMLEKIIKEDAKIHVSYNNIHEVLLEHNMAKECKKKKTKGNG